jgi:hypothetical protein
MRLERIDMRGVTVMLMTVCARVVALNVATGVLLDA